MVPVPLSGRLEIRIAALRQTAVNDGNDSSAIVGSEQAPTVNQTHHGFCAGFCAGLAVETPFFR